MSEHLTELELELARTGEADPACQDHLAQCAHCREQVAFLGDLASAMSQPTAPIEIPEALDRQIAAVIEERVSVARATTGSAGRSGRVRRVMPWAVAAALAASIAIAVGVGVLSPATEAPTPAPVAAGPDDLNRDGRVDILDAFALARAAKAEGATGSGDTPEVARMARIAVALDPGESR